MLSAPQRTKAVAAPAGTAFAAGVAGSRQRKLTERAAAGGGQGPSERPPERPSWQRNDTFRLEVKYLADGVREAFDERALTSGEPGIWKVGSSCEERIQFV